MGLYYPARKSTGVFTARHRPAGFSHVHGTPTRGLAVAYSVPAAHSPPMTWAAGEQPRTRPSRGGLGSVPGHLCGCWVAPRDAGRHLLGVDGGPHLARPGVAMSRRRIRSVRRRVWIHRILAAVWAVLAIPGVLWWPESVLFVICASVYANVASEIAAAEAADDLLVLERLDSIEKALARIEAALGADAGPTAGEG